MTETLSPNNPNYWLESDPTQLDTNMRDFAERARVIPPFDPESEDYQAAFQQFADEFVGPRVENGGFAVTMYLGAIAQRYIADIRSEK